jgi:hypothetical protein
MSEAEKLQKKLQEDRDREVQDLKRSAEKRAEEVTQEKRQRREDELKKKVIWPSYPVSDDE